MALLGKSAQRVEALTDEEYEQRQRGLGLAGQEADLALRKRIANGALVLMVVQILVANGIFVWYGDTNGWNIPPAAISTWLGATVVQIVGVVYVVTQSLFPKR